MESRVYLFNDDCLNVMKNLPDKSVQMILCDLPYGMTQCKWDVIIPFELLWKNYNRICKDDCAIVLFSCQPFTTKLINSNIKKYRYNWYWKKNNVTGGLFAKVQPMRCIEDICVFYKKKPIYNPQGLVKLEKPKLNKPDKKSKVYKIKDNCSLQKYVNYPKNLIEFDKDKEQFHPTQKPVDLLEYLIKTYTNKNDVVLDNCMGSGSTGVAAINTGRRFIGIEKEQKYFNIASERIKKAYLN